MFHRTSLLLAFCLAALLSFTSCSSTSVSTDQELQATEATVEWLVSRDGLVRDPELYQMLARVSRRLHEGSRAVNYRLIAGEEPEPFFRRSVSSPWQVLVLNSPSLNAFSIGTGVIVITKGLITESGTEAELASVLAHEMTHQLLGHTKEALAEEIDSLQSRGPAFHFSLEQELIADTVGVEILKSSRYDIRHAVFALSLAYRAEERRVAPEAKGWLTARMANLDQAIYSSKAYLPATKSTRQFARVQKSLME